MANPEPLLDVLLRQRWLSARYSQQGIIATISALQGANNLRRFPDAKAQVAWADTIVITHTDLADVDQIDSLKKQLSQLSPTANQVIAVNGEVKLDPLIAASPQIRRLTTEIVSENPHSFNSVSLQFLQRLTLAQLIPILQNVMVKYGKRLVRVKGLIFEPESDHPILIQGSVGIFYPPTHLPALVSDDSTNRLVFILDGPIDGLTYDVMQQLQLPPD